MRSSGTTNQLHHQGRSPYAWERSMYHVCTPVEAQEPRSLTEQIGAHRQGDRIVDAFALRTRGRPHSFSYRRHGAGSEASLARQQPEERRHQLSAPRCLWPRHKGATESLRKPDDGVAAKTSTPGDSRVDLGEIRRARRAAQSSSPSRRGQAGSTENMIGPGAAALLQRVAPGTGPPTQKK